MKNFGDITIYESEAEAESEKARATRKAFIVSLLLWVTFLAMLGAAFIAMFATEEPAAWGDNTDVVAWAVAALLLSTWAGLFIYGESLRNSDHAASRVDDAYLLDRLALSEGTADAEEALREIKRQNRLPRYSEAKAILEANKNTDLAKAKARFLGKPGARPANGDS
ncbi:hypothetical protein [Marinimicrobium sp. ABcell2]|uniref:hypothetical protein n=1 Tax=Marinimicrobium sp. ABcell2 TaxID=3069751 RepID=UPI0027B742A1|nr:hypothetical protein [Marinimicrobium sp. ABcell2]MDQ2077377.1 hypothetical protein [Marinimicrobium sp. ABcell2]